MDVQPNPRKGKATGDDADMACTTSQSSLHGSPEHGSRIHGNANEMNDVRQSNSETNVEANDVHGDAKTEPRRRTRNGRDSLRTT